MLVGIYLYDIGVLVWLWSVLPLLIFLVEIVLLTIQVHSEEKRLEKDFGKDYLDYKKRVGRYFTICRLLIKNNNNTKEARNVAVESIVQT